MFANTLRKCFNFLLTALTETMNFNTYWYQIIVPSTSILNHLQPYPKFMLTLFSNICCYSPDSLSYSSPFFLTRTTFLSSCYSPLFSLQHFVLVYSFAFSFSFNVRFFSLTSFCPFPFRFIFCWKLSSYLFSLIKSLQYQLSRIITRLFTL